MKKSFLLTIALITYTLLLTPYSSFSQCNYGWIEKLGRSTSDEWVGKGSAVDKDGNIYIAGGFTGVTTLDGITLSSNGDIDMFVAKFDKDLNIIWARSFGGEDLDALNGLKVDDYGNIYVYGDIFSSAIGVTIPELSQTFKSKGNLDLFFAKLDNDGNFLWAKSYGDTQYDFVRDIAFDQDQNVYVIGNFRNDQVFDTINMISNNPGGTSAAYDNFFVAKYDIDGNIQWAKQSTNTSTTNGQLWGLTINVALSGSVYLRASLFNGEDTTWLEGHSISNGGLCLIKYNTAGNLQWINNPQYNGTTISPRAVAIDNNENIIILGHSKSGSGDFVLGLDTIQQAEGFYIIKIDSAGNYLWARNSDGKTDNVNGGVFPKKIDIDENNNIYVAGVFYIRMLFNGTNVLTYNQDIEWPTADVFYCKFDSLGEPVWAKRLGNQDFLDSYSYNIDYNDGKLISTGIYYNSCTYDDNEGLTIGIPGVITDLDKNLFVLNMNTEGDIILPDFAGEDKTMIRCDSIEIGNVDYSGFSYNWTSQDNISTPTVYKSFVAPISNTDYMVSLTDNSTACVYNDTVFVTVEEPDYEIAFAADKRIHTAAPATVVFTNNTPDPGNYDFVWFFGDGESSTDSDPIHTYTIGGKMDVSLIATEKSSGCIDTLTYTEFIHIPVGLEEIESSLFSISPNPSNGKFTIEMSDVRCQMSDVKYQITDITGKVISNLQFTINNLQFTIDMENQPKGMYFIKIETENTVYTKKIIIN